MIEMVQKSFDENVEKSYIPGKGYLPATKAGAGVLRQAAADRKTEAAVEALIKPHRNAKGRKIFSRVSLTGPGKTGTVRRMPQSHPANRRGGGLAMPDGRGGGAVFADDALTFRHEMAHIRPKRNFVNYRDRAHRSQRVAGREEGRAEFEAHGHAGPTYPDYSQRSTDWRTGYEEVQNRMARARARKEGKVRKMHDEDIEKMSPRAAANSAGAFVGAHWTTKLSRVADWVEPYQAKRRKPVPRPLVDRHLPNFKRVGVKGVNAARQKAAETTRSISYDISSINDKDKLIREVATGQGKLRPIVAKSFFRGRYIPVTEMHPKTLAAHRNDVRMAKEHRGQLKGADIKFSRAGTKNGLPRLSRAHVEGPNVKNWGYTRALEQKALNQGYYVARHGHRRANHTFKNTVTGKAGDLQNGVTKSYTPWDGITSEVSKMGPDQSELHVAGSSNQRRKARLRKLPPDAIRRI